MLCLFFAWGDNLSEYPCILFYIKQGEGKYSWDNKKLPKVGFVILFCHSWLQSVESDHRYKDFQSFDSRYFIKIDVAIGTRTEVGVKEKHLKL